MKLQNQGHPNASLKTERVQRADGSADAAQPQAEPQTLKAERVQRPVKAEPPPAVPGASRATPSVDVARRLQRLPGWRIEPQGALHKTFTSTDSTGARYFAEAIRQATADLHQPPVIQRRDRTVQITLHSPPEGLTENEFTLAAVIEDRWSEG